MRRWHIAAVVKDHMVVHGGLDSKNSILDDLAVFDFKEAKWRVKHMNGFKVGPMAYHTAVTVLTKNQLTMPKFNLYRPVYEDLEEDDLKETGVYIFGGLKPMGIATNDVYILKVG